MSATTSIPVSNRSCRISPLGSRNNSSLRYSGGHSFLCRQRILSVHLAQDGFESHRGWVGSLLTSGTRTKGRLNSPCVSLYFSVRFQGGAVCTKSGGLVHV